MLSPTPGQWPLKPPCQHPALTSNRAHSKASAAHTHATAMFGFLADPDSVKQAAEMNKTGKAGDEGDDEAALPGLPSLGGLWSVAKAVQSAVQATADDVVRSVAQTDWRSELTAFTHEVEAEAHRAVEVVQHLPDKLQQQAGGAAAERGSPRAPHKAAASSGSDGAGVQQQQAAGFGGVGSSLAQFGKQLISGTKEVLDTVTDMVEGELATAAREVPRLAAGGRSGSASSSTRGGEAAGRSRLAATRYSRFESEVAAMQRDSATYCDEPEDAADYAAWRSSSAYDSQACQAEIDKVLAGNAFMSELQSRLVPLLVEKEVFWARYFYRLHKLQQKEEQRQQLAARAKQLEDHEELGGWDDDDSPRTTAAAAAAQEEQQQEQQAAQDEGASKPNAAAAQAAQQQQQEAAGDPPAPSAAGSNASEPAAPAVAEQQQPAGTEQPSSSGTADAAAADAAGTRLGAPAAAAAVAGAASVAATTCGAGAATAAGLARKVSEESSFPSTPVQIGSDASDAALATDTVSDSSAATAAAGGGSGAAPWTAVGSVPAAKPASPSQLSGAGAPAAAAPATAAVGKGPAASDPAKPAAAAAAAEDDDDWGDDADDAAAAVSTLGSKAGGAAAVVDDDDDWE